VGKEKNLKNKLKDKFRNRIDRIEKQRDMKRVGSPGKTQLRRGQSKTSSMSISKAAKRDDVESAFEEFKNY